MDGRGGGRVWDEPASAREAERAGLRWALADLERLRARGLLDQPACDTLRRDYEARLRRLDAAPAPAPTGAAPHPDEGYSALPAAARAGALVAGRAPPARAGAADRPPRPPTADGNGRRAAEPRVAPGLALAGATDAWTHALLGLGAALVLAAALLFAVRGGLAPDPYPFAWACAAGATLATGALWPLRRRGAPRAWDSYLIAAGQGVALTAGGLALAGGDWPRIALLLWLCTAVAAAVVALERRERALLLPNLWALGAVAATLAALGSGPRWMPAACAGLGLAGALGLHGWRGVPPHRRRGWFMAHRWTAGGWAALGPALAAIELREPFARFLASRELLDLVLHPAYGPAALAVTLCGLALAADAALTLRRPTGYGASATLAAAALLGIARVTPNNPQAYAVPLGLYLLTLSIYVVYERDLGPVRMRATANTLLAAAVLAILGATLLQSLEQPWRYFLLGLGEGLALLALTLFLRRRAGVALTLLFLALTALRGAVEAARALPTWTSVGLLGLALLGSGLLILLRRDRVERWWRAAAARWARLT